MSFPGDASAAGAKDESQKMQAAKQEEMLGDQFWLKRETDDGYRQASFHYQNALRYWATAPDMKQASEHTFKIIRILSAPIWPESDYDMGYAGTFLSVPIIEPAIRLARTPEDKAYSHYLMTRRLMHHNHNPALDDQKRLRTSLKALIDMGRSTAWYDYALFHYPDVAGPEGKGTDGKIQLQPDYELALVHYRKILKEYKKGETPFYEQAESGIQTITTPGVQVVGWGGNEQLIHWRNVKSIDFAIYPISIIQDIQPEESDTNTDAVFRRISAKGKKVLKSWTKTVPSEHYIPHYEPIAELNELPMGAYIVEARAGDVISQNYFLKTDCKMDYSNSAKEGVLFIKRGESVSAKSLQVGADIVLWERFPINTSDPSQYKWRKRLLKTDANGHAFINLELDQDWPVSFLAFGQAGASPAYTQGTFLYKKKQ